jgi:hypothetical protein
MEYFSSEERSTPDSCSTSDFSSHGDLIGSVSKTSKINLRKKHKKITKDIFNILKSQYFHLSNDSFEFKLAVNQIFIENSCENLMEKFKFRCCKNEEHCIYCEKKWQRIREDLLDMADEELKSSKDVFVIRKKRCSKFGVLLNASQPSWIHRIMVQNLFNSSNN